MKNKKEHAYPCTNRETNIDNVDSKTWKVCKTTYQQDKAKIRPTEIKMITTEIVTSRETKTISHAPPPKPGLSKEGIGWLL